MLLLDLDQIFRFKWKKMQDDNVKLLKNLIRCMQNDAKYLIYGLIIAGIRARASGHRPSDIYRFIESMIIISPNLY